MSEHEQIIRRLDVIIGQLQVLLSVFGPLGVEESGPEAPTQELQDLPSFNGGPQPRPRG